VRVDVFAVVPVVDILVVLAPNVDAAL